MKTDVEIYCTCMEDLLPRMKLVRSVFTKEVTTGQDFLDAELVFLQFRKMLEQIAFSSLAANKAIYSAARQKFATDWRAIKMLEYVEQANPNFYPQPFRQGTIENRSGRRYIRMEDVTEGFLTKEDFIKLYDYSSDLLHARNPYAGTGPTVNVGRTPQDWLTRIENLVKLHRTKLITGVYWLGAVPDIDGKVHTYTAEPFTAST